MKLKSFRHPDLSLPVIRRRMADELLELLGGVGEVLATRGQCLTWNSGFATRAAYDSAMYRLRKAGLIARRRRSDGRVLLTLTDRGRSRLSDVWHPGRCWSRKWSGIWYVLVYDVPEENRAFRNTLRIFLMRMRMGCLQRSVWVSPRDIRPEYDELASAAGIAPYVFLMEARTVLGQSAQDVVRAAWDFERLNAVQRWYGEVYEENLRRVQSGLLGPGDLMALAREEMSAYRVAMAEDPLLPRELWPPGYRGPAVYALHSRIVEAIGSRI